MNGILSDTPMYWNRVYSEFHGNAPARTSVWNEKPTPFLARSTDWLLTLGVRNILDAGCGDGRNLTPFVDAGFDVTGIDYSSQAIDCCRKNLPDAHNLTLICNPLDKIPLDSESVSTIICDHVIVHLSHPETVIEEFHRIIRTGGYALLEFTSLLDSTFGQGKRLAKKKFCQNGVYLRYYEPSDFIGILQDWFEVVYFTSEYSTDPPHGSGYVRAERHDHHSYFVVVKKIS